MPMADWKIYKGDNASNSAAQFAERPSPPPWRDYRARRGHQTAGTFQASPADVEMVNAALHLRRPLLITGKPGCGKSSLARSVAQELGLGEVLRWPINTKSTLQEGLYRYDAVGRLQAAALAAKGKSQKEVPDIGQFLRLGPLGTALLPGERTRVLLLDEIDKSDIDLPSDLLHVFEQGEFEIPELVRLLKDGLNTRVRVHDSDDWVEIADGWVRADSFPLVFMTSNGERDFPPAFMRRCLHLSMKSPDRELLVKIITAHLGPNVLEAGMPLIEAFLDLRDQKNKELATDQLLNAIYLVARLDGQVNREQLASILFRSTSSGAP
jgi:MoxR-like ATPase